MGEPTLHEAIAAHAANAALTMGQLVDCLDQMAGVVAVWEQHSPGAEADFAAAAKQVRRLAVWRPG